MQPTASRVLNNRWTIALSGAMFMMTLGTIYSWSLFAQPLLACFGWSNTTVTWTFALAIFSLGTGAVSTLNSVGCYVSMNGNSVIIPPALGTIGNAGRNIFRDLGLKNWDVSVIKETKFKERLTAQFRAEVFNLFNHPTFANPYGGPGGGTVDPSSGAGFGFTGQTPDVQSSNSVLGSGGARATQLGLKLIF